MDALRGRGWVIERDVHPHDMATQFDAGTNTLLSPEHLV